MKKVLILLALVAGTTVLSQAQIDRSQAPAPGPAPQINIGTPASFTTDNGIQVFVVESHKVPRVTVSLLLKKDPVLEGDKAGYVSMAGSMMRRGTETKSKAELDKAIDFLGGHVSTGSGSASASSLSKNFDQVFGLFADVVLHPAFRDSELVKVKTRTLSALKSAEDDPGAILSNVVSVVNYGTGHPYGEVETPETVQRITTADLKKYYATYWRPNIAYMAFVGDITTEHARQLVDRYLKSWKRAPVPEQKYPQPQKPDQRMIYVANRPAAVQTNIDITAPIELKPGAPDYFAVRLMNQILGGGSSGWLFQDLREKYGFTYGAYSSISSDPLVGSFSARAAVRNAVTDSSLMRFMYLLNRIRDTTVSQIKLDSAKNLISGNFALSLERPAQIAQFALNIARYDMPADYYKNYLKSIAAVSIAQIQQAARKYISPDQTNIVLVGNAKDFADSLAKYGSVQYVDIYGNPVDPPVHKAVSEAVSAADVVNKYLDAIGGKAALAQVKDLTITASTEMQGQKIEAVQQYLLPDHYSMEVVLPAQKMTLTKALVKGTAVSVQQMGQDMPLSADKKAALQGQAKPFPERHFMEEGYQLKLSGIESVDDKEAYVLEVTKPSGEESTYYFDTQTGLELRQITKIKGADQTVQQRADFRDYKPVDGILFPSVVKTQTDKLTMELHVDSIEINSGLSDADFQ